MADSFIRLGARILNLSMLVEADLADDTLDLRFCDGSTILLEGPDAAAVRERLSRFVRPAGHGAAGVLQPSPDGRALAAR